MVVELITFDLMQPNHANCLITRFIIQHDWIGWTNNQKRQWLQFVYSTNTLLECVITHLGNDMVNWRVVRRSSIEGGFDEAADRSFTVDGIDQEIDRILH